MPKGIYKRKKKHIYALIRRNKSDEMRKKVSEGLKGHGFSEETLEKMRKNHADVKGEKNPNWKGDNVGLIGVHLWLRKNFIKKCVCEFCGKKGTTKEIQWAKRKGCKYKRKRENFIELCCKCHSNYDRNKLFCINEHKMIKENLYNTKSGRRLCKKCNKMYSKKKENK